ncbi:hypothetical protein BGX26_007550, partial [Mortierella sp. AD094]
MPAPMTSPFPTTSFSTVYPPLHSLASGVEEMPSQPTLSFNGPASPYLPDMGDKRYSLRSTSKDPQASYDTSDASNVYGIRMHMPSSDIGSRSSTDQTWRQPQEYLPPQQQTHRLSPPQYYPPPVPFQEHQQQQQQLQYLHNTNPLYPEQQRQDPQQWQEQNSGISDDQVLQRQIALTRAQHEQTLERIRREQEAELRMLQGRLNSRS